MGNKQNKKRGRKKRQCKVDKLKIHYFKIYKSWKKVYCPALKAEVLFTNWGWDHLFQEKWRTKKEAEERLKILPLGKKLIEISTTIYRKRFQNYHDHYEFKAWMNGENVSALVIEYKKKFYFYSVHKD
ncbi:hypothetical protein M1349_01145 [Patescibacteria group bacterium]|nr:hypothetical protein [Patescibacteria group bacterium]